MGGFQEGNIAKVKEKIVLDQDENEIRRNDQQFEYEPQGENGDQACVLKILIQ